MQAVFLAMCLMCQTEPYLVPGVGMSYAPMIHKYADLRLVSRSFAYRVAMAESDFFPMANARHHSGLSRGLYQINTRHQKELVKRAGLTRFNWKDARQSAWVGISYLSRLSKHYKGNQYLVLAGYNFGPGNVDAGKKWPMETIKYIRRVMK